MAKITIYNTGDARYLDQGDSKFFDGGELDLTKVGRGFLGTGNWNDKAKFVLVEEGTWRLYKDANRGGEHWDYGVGLHWVGDKAISGLEPI